MLVYLVSNQIMNIATRRCIKCNVEVTQLNGKLKDHSASDITTRVPICNDCIVKEQTALKIINGQEMDSKNFIYSNLIIAGLFIIFLIIQIILLFISNEYYMIISLIFSFIQIKFVLKFFDKQFIIILKPLFKAYYALLTGFTYYISVFISEIIYAYEIYFPKESTFSNNALTTFSLFIGILFEPYHIMTLIFSIIIAMLTIRNWSKKIPKIKYYDIK